jgi:hypothetical protein
MAAISHRAPLAERFWSKVEKAGADSCWPWKAGYFQNGYGAFFGDRGETGRAHRMAWKLTHGPVPDGMFVLHRCGVRACVNPGHLVLEDPGDLAARFRAKVSSRPALGCWLWQGKLSTSGYGQLSVEGGRRGAHRISWVLAHGPIPNGLHVLHRCDTPPCVNPEHLFLGTHADNMHDCALKGRTAAGNRNGTRTHPESLRRGDEHGMRRHPDRAPRGSRNGQARITEEDVRQLRGQQALGATMAALAIAFGISPRQIRDILRRVAWGHVA